MSTTDRASIVHLHTDEENKLPSTDNIKLGEIAVNHNSNTPFISFKTVNENNESSLVTVVTTVQKSDDTDTPSISNGKLTLPSYIDRELKSNKITEISSGSTDEEYASAAAVYKFVQSQTLSHDVYELVVNDDGSLECVKNNTEEGFQLNEDGSLELL